MILLLGLVTGIAFGAVLMLSGLSNPGLIIRMLRLESLFLVKVLVTALAAGIAGVALLTALGQAHLDVKTLHTIAVLVGGAIFGVGFALAGYCPGTSLAAAAEGRTDALFAVVGGLAGTAAFTALYASLEPVLVAPLSFGKPTLPTWLGLPGPVFGLALGAVLAAVIVWWWRQERPQRERAAGGGIVTQAR
jgi:uncharacterized membrane protein YedE/YeeE